MDRRERLYSTMAIVGEILVVAGAAIWVTRWAWVNYVYALGTTLFAIGRFSIDYKFTLPSASPTHDKTSNLVLRRLYRQRMFGNVVLLLSALVMNMHTGFYGGIFVGRSSWIVFFTIFVVFELYTAFRIPHVMDKKE